MIDKEIGELRRRLRPEKNNITSIYGCYVTGKGEILSQFSQSVGLMPQNENEKYLALLKRSLSGTLHKNLIDIVFRTQQVAQSEEHRLLMQLRDTQLKDETVRQAFYERVIGSITMEENYLILLAYDTYDVPRRTKDHVMQLDASDETFSYVLCCVCPVKLSKSALRYVIEENEFHDKAAGWVVSAPELGFMFPAFDNRRTNLYNALYYCHDLTQSHEDFVTAIFNTEIPQPAAQQKQSFESLLSNALEDACDYEVVQSVHEQLSLMIQSHKESKQEEPLQVGQSEVKQVLQTCGIPEPQLAKFAVKFDEEFGTGAQLSPQNLIDEKHFQVRTPDVVIQVSPERSDLIETRVLNGVKYIMICADENVEVNGVNVHISDKS